MTFAHADAPLCARDTREDARQEKPLHVEYDVEAARSEERVRLAQEAKGFYEASMRDGTVKGTPVPDDPFVDG